MCWEAVMLGYEFYKLTILDLHDYLNLDEKGPLFKLFVIFSRKEAFYLKQNTLNYEKLAAKLKQLGHV